MGGRHVRLDEGRRDGQVRAHLARADPDAGVRRRGDSARGRLRGHAQALRHLIERGAAPVPRDLRPGRGAPLRDPDPPLQQDRAQAPRDPRAEADAPLPRGAPAREGSDAVDVGHPRLRPLRQALLRDVLPHVPRHALRRPLRPHPRRRVAPPGLRRALPEDRRDGSGHAEGAPEAPRRAARPDGADVQAPRLRHRHVRLRRGAVLRAAEPRHRDEADPSRDPQRQGRGLAARRGRGAAPQGARRPARYAGVMELRKWPRRNDAESIAARQQALDGRVDPEVFSLDVSPWANAQEALTGVAVVPVAVVGPLTIELGQYELSEPDGALVEKGRAQGGGVRPARAHRGRALRLALPRRPRRPRSRAGSRPTCCATA